MVVFSVRNGYKGSEMQLEAASDVLRSRVFMEFYKRKLDGLGGVDCFDYTVTILEDMMVEMGLAPDLSRSEGSKQRNIETLQKFLRTKEWYYIFDFIEKYLRKLSDAEVAEATEAFNRILEEESSAYRVCGRLVIPITSETELIAVQEARSTKYDSVNAHITKALSHYSKRKNPDYENSIKESISAVEAMCCVITGAKGGQATLGKTLKKLEDKGVHIHDAMKDAFSKLYGYTSDEPGLRHGGVAFKGAAAEDARFMLVSCSAFVNYLIEKWSKNDPAGSSDTDNKKAKA